jgi:hypothetical protein
MGHSFGGATAIHAAISGPKPPKSVLAHDPANDWLPDTSRLALFDIERLRESTTDHSYWTRNNLSVEDRGEEKPMSIHDVTEVLTLFSDEWYQKKFSGVEILKDMYDRNVFGRASGKSRFKVIDDAYHQEFADVSMLTPLWIARASGLTGPRNPIDTAREIHTETLDFLNSL